MLQSDLIFRMRSDRLEHSEVEAQAAQSLFQRRVNFLILSFCISAPRTHELTAIYGVI